MISKLLLETRSALVWEEGRSPGKVANYWADSIDFLAIALLFTRLRAVECQPVPNLSTKLTARHIIS